MASPSPVLKFQSHKLTHREQANIAEDESSLPYAERPSWADLKPIPQDDGPAPLVPIFYSADYRDAMDMFRAVAAANEKSERALDLTEDIIRMNPAHYTIWQYRTSILLELGLDLKAELALMDELVNENLKSYQVWHHRRLLVTLLSLPPPPSGEPLTVPPPSISTPPTPSALPLANVELAFIASSLTATADAKNYHTWAYRQWALAFFSPLFTPQGREWERELEFVDKLLDEDVRNNSAWTHRFFVVFESGWEGADRAAEVEYAKTRILLAPSSPSAWNYLRGLLPRLPTPLPLSSQNPFAAPLAARDPPVLPALEWLADAGADGAEEAYGKLAGLDPVRRRYWDFRRAELSRGRAVESAA